LRKLHNALMAIFQRLQDWQDLKGIKDGELAEKIGCGRSVLSRAKRGIHALKMKHQIALEELTGIKPSEWADFYADLAKEKAEGEAGGKPAKRPFGAARIVEPEPVQ
jgi:hypothetical protein